MYSSALFFAVLVLIGFTNTQTNAESIPAEGRDIGLSTCEKLYGLLAYPRVVQNVTVLRISPLRVRVHLLAQGPSQSIRFSVDGMVCQHGFDQNAANAACRSENFNHAVLVPNVTWQPPAPGSGQECIMDTDNYKSVIPCEFILNQVSCPVTATSLGQCRFPPIFTPSAQCNRYTHVGLVCT